VGIACDGGGGGGGVAAAVVMAVVVVEGGEKKKKWNSTHTHSRALEGGKQAAGKIADVLRQCYAFVISQAGMVALGSSRV